MEYEIDFYLLVMEKSLAMQYAFAIHMMGANPGMLA